ncbi:kinase A inhibitor [Maritalea myrionectae]|uniref:Kinase A inhibitor n=1 Tax=Maritalea myrionectae TaxID=454601 RepID=A0A2R4MF79_9HYPH|nr:carboxyltransferase domain-containing protein [Maritalea myrionectae]AVX04660.1 kinase A inhibitor [Maritalea myrionectae]
MSESEPHTPPRARIKLQPLGDKAILVVFDTQLRLNANRQAIQFTQLVQEKLASYIVGANSNLLSCLVRYNPKRTSFSVLRQELQMLLASFDLEKERPQIGTDPKLITVSYGGENGPDFDAVHRDLKLTGQDFIAQHTANVLDVLALGFSPGFVYLGLHENWQHYPRRAQMRENVPPGSVLFAAGQTAITSVPIRTGWSVIGHCHLNNFDLQRDPPVQLCPGDVVQFQSAEADNV